MAMFARQNLRLLLKKIRAPTRLVPVRFQGSLANPEVAPEGVDPEEYAAILEMEKLEKARDEAYRKLGLTIINQKGILHRDELGQGPVEGKDLYNAEMSHSAYWKPLRDDIHWWKWYAYGMVMAPLCVLFTAFTIYHEEHLNRPKFIAYEHMRIRNKPFPYRDGQKCLIYNPKLMALPDGYEFTMEELGLDEHGHPLKH